MNIMQCEQQILRTKIRSFQPELDEALEHELRKAALFAVKTTLEAALKEENNQNLEKLSKKPRRSGYFKRGLNTQYGHLSDLKVPKIRNQNKERTWKILKRYQRSLGSLLNWACGLYVMGLSIRDLQEALEYVLGKVLSTTSINKVTLEIQEKIDEYRLYAIKKSPKILIVDGVWVNIQYTTEEFKKDRSGHLRQCREAEERVVLSALAVWEDGSHEMLHYEVAKEEGSDEWDLFFKNLEKRGLDRECIELVVSDGSVGLPGILQKRFPNAKQQRCMTHKVRGIERYLNYTDINKDNSKKYAELKQQRKFEITSDAYEIYEADNKNDAEQRLKNFVEKWKALEPKAVEVFQYDIDLTFTFYNFDKSLHPHIRTTNRLERLFREFRTKSDEIGAFPNETSCLTVFFLIVQRDHAKHNRSSVAKN